MKVLSVVCKPHELQATEDMVAQEGGSIFRVHDIYWRNGPEKALEYHKVMFYVLDDEVATMLTLKYPPGTFTEHSV
jgi:hypothetical protein